MFDFMQTRNFFAVRKNETNQIFLTIQKQIFIYKFHPI